MDLFTTHSAVATVRETGVLPSDFTLRVGEALTLGRLATHFGEQLPVQVVFDLLVETVSCSVQGDEGQPLAIACERVGVCYSRVATAASWHADELNAVLTRMRQASNPRTLAAS